MHRITKPIGVIFLAIFAFVILGVACSDTAGDQARADSVDARNDSFARAEALYPIPITTNFPAREALVEYTIRQDRPNHPYYVYILGENGSITHYFVSKTLPVNVCAFLSSTEDVRTSSNGNLKMTAPSLDGIFYGGAGASAACDGLILFDQATDAMFVVYGPGTIISDAPLKLDLKPVQIEIVGGSSP